ncbi:MAG: hypothetical protein IH796_09365 [Deltaproteobacteria bacterium]|nr:hypothetical protein [Deltaproteobacteria bacterium]
MDTLSTAYALGSIKQNAPRLPVNQPASGKETSIFTVHPSDSISGLIFELRHKGFSRPERYWRPLQGLQRVGWDRKPTIGKVRWPVFLLLRVSSPGAMVNPLGREDKIAHLGT